MLWTIVVICLLLWLLGGFGIGWMAFGGLLHLLLVIAVVVIVFNLLTGRRTTP